jgi:fatty acid synthase, animal type
VSKADISTFNGCKDLIKEATSLGPVGGVFNLAVKLHDAILANQTEEMFFESMKPKAIGILFSLEFS